MLNLSLPFHGGGRLGSFSCGVAALALSALAVACSTPTTSAGVWKNPNYVAGPVKNVIVFGGRMDETQRRLVEDGFVHELSQHGVHAIASYVAFPGPVPNRPEAQQVVQSGGYDGVLVSTMRGVAERTTVVPGAAYSGPFWGGFYGPAWGSTWAPAYVATDTYVKFETTLWDPIGNGTMIWSNLTETQNPTSAPDFVRSLVRHVIPAMEEAGLLGKAGAPVSLAPSPAFEPARAPGAN